MIEEDNNFKAPRYRIGTVTRLTGLSADVIRVWERRYGAVKPSRSGGGSRLYSEEDVARLRRLRQAIERGHNIGQVVKLEESDLERLLGEARGAADEPDPYRLSRERFTKAIERMDVVAADLELSRAATLFPARALIKKIVAPILDEVGEKWAHKDIGVAHEHLASNLLRNLLSSLFRLYPPGSAAETMVMATPAGERHEFGLLLAALLVATHGWKTVYLGADLPASEIVYSVRLTGARFLALSIIGPGDEKIEKELEAIASEVGPGVRVWIGGADAVNYREFIERANWVLIRDLDDLDDRLKR
ncbi:MAG TPA: MerR family transcriptional regulator [Blastocatellia bacterium]|nr:MerR family transcriptional regulator [Blastocatellia bacterium]